MSNYEEFIIHQKGLFRGSRDQENMQNISRVKGNRTKIKKKLGNFDFHRDQRRFSKEHLSRTFTSYLVEFQNKVELKCNRSLRLSISTQEKAPEGFRVDQEHLFSL